jgi:ring-1,2-phenylacetyl-CoA epoxidase subunit PaaE
MASRVKIFLDGKEHLVTIKNGETILEAALDANLDPPHACRVAACCSCRALLLEGSVEMDDDEPLTQEEIDEGFILTCQSHPTSEHVTITYDDF